MKCVLHLNKPKQITIGPGDIATDELSANFFQGEALVAAMKSPRLLFIGPDGLKICGFEYTKTNRQGVEQYQYCEWYCQFKE